MVISSPVSSICSRRSRRMLVPCLSSGHCGQRETKETIVFLLGDLWRGCSMALLRSFVPKLRRYLYVDACFHAGNFIALHFIPYPIPKVPSEALSGADG